MANNLFKAVGPGGGTYEVRETGGSAALYLNGTLLAVGAQQANIVSLTDSSGGTASDTIAAISATPTQAEVANAVASLAAKVNAVLSALETNGLLASS